MYIVKLSTAILWKRHVYQIVAPDTGDTNVNNQTSEQLIRESVAFNLSQSTDIPILSPSSLLGPVQFHPPTLLSVSPVNQSADQVNKTVSPAVVRRLQRTRRKVDKVDL